MQNDLTKEELIKNLLENVNYVITGVEDGWFCTKGRYNKKLIETCYLIKNLSQNSYDKLFKFQDKGYKIKL